MWLLVIAKVYKPVMTIKQSLNLRCRGLTRNRWAQRKSVYKHISVIISKQIDGIFYGLGLVLRRCYGLAAANV